MSLIRHSSQGNWYCCLSIIDLNSKYYTRIAQTVLKLKARICSFTFCKRRSRQHSCVQFFAKNSFHVVICQSKQFRRKYSGLNPTQLKDSISVNESIYSDRLCAYLLHMHGHMNVSLRPLMLKIIFRAALTYCTFHSKHSRPITHDKASSYCFARFKLIQNKSKDSN